MSGAKVAYIDGELCGFGDDGLSSLAKRSARLLYYAFDCGDGDVADRSRSGLTIPEAPTLRSPHGNVTKPVRTKRGSGDVFGGPARPGQRRGNAGWPSVDGVGVRAGSSKPAHGFTRDQADTVTSTACASATAINNRLITCSSVKERF
jgi:hypothetical protein